MTAISGGAKLEVGGGGVGEWHEGIVDGEGDSSSSGNASYMHTSRSTYSSVIRVNPMSMPLDVR